MGIMKPQQQPTEPQTCTTKTNNNNKTMNLDKKTTTTLSNLSKQSKTLHNQQLLKECQTNEEHSKIPVIRATARLMDFDTTDSLVGSSATIPPMRSNMRLQHHMLLRGRSRIRHHRRNTGVAVGVGVTTPCTSVTARYYRDVSGIPRNQEGRSTSATLELQPKEMLALRFSAPCSNNNNNNKNNTSFKEKNNTHNTSTSTSNNVDNANDDPPSSDNSYSISSISASSITRPVIRRRFNASLSSTDTNLLNSPTTTTTTTPTANLDECGNYDISTTTTTTSSTCSLVEDNNHNRACHATESGSSSAGSCCTTVSAIKRNNNKRSLSSTRIEKDKYDEYNTKLLRKTTPPMGNYGQNKKSINNNNNNNNNVNTVNNKQEIKKFTTTTIVGGKTCTRLARTHASCQDVRSMTNKESTTATATVTGRGGSFKEYSTSGIPTATNKI